METAEEKVITAAAPHLKITSYLTFNGNCREAMTFYRDCLGGELVFQMVGDAPFSGGLPKKMKKMILQATLTKGELLLVGTDLVGEGGLWRGNSVSLMLNCGDEAEVREYYARLSRDGWQLQSVSQTFYGAWQGNLTDKFGNNWLLYTGNHGNNTA